MRIVLNEMSSNKNAYYLRLDYLEEIILCHVSYFLVYDIKNTYNHWKQDVFALTKRLKSTNVKGCNKEEVVREALVEDPHGDHFKEEIENPEGILNAIYDSEDRSHEFDSDMSDEHNRSVYFDAINKFYYEFLIPWISKTDKNPKREEIYDAIDKYLISRRVDMN